MKQLFTLKRRKMKVLTSALIKMQSHRKIRNEKEKESNGSFIQHNSFKLCPVTKELITRTGPIPKAVFADVNLHRKGVLYCCR